jgi:hypothetical protein
LITTNEQTSEKRSHEKTSHVDLHAFRKRSGYYADALIEGLDEAIDALRSTDTLVWLGVIETSRGWVAIWRDEHGTPLGVMIFKAKRDAR